MKADTFSALVDSMNEALEHAQGKQSLRTVTLPRPPAPFSGLAVKKVRTRLRASQAVFASYLNVSAKLVQAWEAGRRRPEGPALVLLHIADTQPGVLETLRHWTGGKRRRSRSVPPTSRHAAATR
jgi:putative transcriptional regulator